MRHYTRTLHGILIASAGIVLLAGCWDADFTTYDDQVHIGENQQVERQFSLFEIFKPAPGSTYFPVTILSYKLDSVLFPSGTKAWAPGVRFMSFVYHAAAALILWRVLLLLGLTELQALFVAIVFAVHPLACETVCWVSERKNALAAVFGFWALWAWLRAETHTAWWRGCAAAALYALALMSKPSALGLLPVFFFLSVFGGARGLSPSSPQNLKLMSVWKQGKQWLDLVERMLPLAALSVGAAALNLSRYAKIPPPGGTLFTAILTDFEILTRYLFNLGIPVALSAVYRVDAVRSVSDPRVILYGLTLLLLAGITVNIASNRRRVIFGWLWFLGALGPSLNLISLPHLMQDRYVYLSTPGFFIVLVEAVDGIYSRASFRGPAETPATGKRRSMVLLGCAYVAVLAALAGARGMVWRDNQTIFSDAVAKQPGAAFAHFGLGSAYAQKWNDLSFVPNTPRQEIESYHRRWMSEWRAGLACADIGRYSRSFWEMTEAVSADCLARGDFDRPEHFGVEHYWAQMAYPPSELADDPGRRSVALANLALRRMEQGQAHISYGMAAEAVRIFSQDYTRFVRARISVNLAAIVNKAGIEIEARRLIAEARGDLLSIEEKSGAYTAAQTMLRDPVFAPNPALSGKGN